MCARVCVLEGGAVINSGLRTEVTAGGGSTNEVIFLDTMDFLPPVRDKKNLLNRASKTNRSSRRRLGPSQTPRLFVLVP